MLFNSVEFFGFFPTVCIIYFILPHKYRHIWLLLSSYIFYMNWNAGYVLLLLAVTMNSYGFGILIDRVNHQSSMYGSEYEVGQGGSSKKKLYLILTVLGNLVILCYFKYFSWLVNMLNEAFLSKGGLHIRVPEIILPVGISFFIFQALGYTIDVYRGEINAQHNFLKYALFVAFFPQLVAGPIERSKTLLSQIEEEHKFDYTRMLRGLLLMLWGYFLKLVIADRIALFVDTVFGDYGSYSGLIIMLAAILFAFQIYCDFAGYSTIAAGAAEVMGFHLMDNFNCPYFSKSIREFWRRWHISLSTWFRDYLYIPLGGSRKGLQRTLINIFVVFLASGLWHGANWTFVLWGAFMDSIRWLRFLQTRLAIGFTSYYASMKKRLGLGFTGEF